MKFLLAFVSLVFLNSCSLLDCTDGAGPISTKTYDQGSFDSFTLSSSADVQLIPSSKNAIEITTYDNIHEKIEIENNGGEIDVDMKGCINLDRTMQVRVFFTQLSKVELSGSGNIVSTDTIKSDRFEISITGSGDANIITTAETVEANILGSGDIQLKGYTKQFRGKINGSGNIKATEFNAANTDISINGSGDADLGSCNNLNSKVNGSGNVNCKGKQ